MFSGMYIMPGPTLMHHSLSPVAFSSFHNLNRRMHNTCSDKWCSLSLKLASPGCKSRDVPQEKNKHRPQTK